MRIAADLTRTGGNQPHVVIPHSYADHEFAQKLAGALRHDRVTHRIDDLDMSAGAFLVNRVLQAARPVDCVVAVLSTASVSANWVQHDLRTMLARNLGERHLRVLPARIDDSVLPSFLSSHPTFDFHRYGWSAAYDELLVAIHQHATVRPATAAPPGFRLPRPGRLT